MRGIVTALILEALVVWQAFWAARILWGAQGTVPLLAFVGGLLAIAGSLAYLSQPTRAEHLASCEACRTSPPERFGRLGANGHSRYSLTWPATRTRPYQRRVR